MRNLPTLIFCIICPISAPALAADLFDHFEGTWDTVLSCPNSNGALGYSYKFPATVKNGILHAEKGEPNKPGWLAINGTISSDGSSSLYADGIVGAAPYAVGRRPAGTPYNYHIEAKFTDTSGIGHRIEGRPCDLSFTKEK